MAVPFAKTLTFLEAEERGPSGIVAVVAVGVIAAWATWLVLAQTTVYAVSEEGRLLAAGAASPVQTPVAGVIAENLLVLGGEVKPGDVVARLETRAEALRKDEETTRVAGLTLAAEDLEHIIEAERALAQASITAVRTRVSSASTRAKVAGEIAALAREQDDAIRRLKESSLVSGLDSLKSAEDVQRQRGQVRILSADSNEASADVARTQLQTNVRLLTLGKDLTDLRARIAASQSVIATLDWEIARRTLRAPVGGSVADLVALPKGAAVSPGDVLATIVPESQLRWVAYFPPREAVGRIHPGQHARVRLDAFPWTAYGALGATVIGVGSEPREQRVRVELALDGANRNVPLSHGLTGTVDVEVEELSPFRMLLRLTGQYVQGGRNAATPPASSTSPAAR